MILKPQDIVVLLKIAALPQPGWSYAPLALELGMSSSEVHAGVKRLVAAGLLDLQMAYISPMVPPAIRSMIASREMANPVSGGGIQRKGLFDLLRFGVPYIFAPDRGAMTRGVPTAHAAPPLNTQILPDGEPVPVWPDPEGEARGLAFSPLYKSVPLAARNDARLYELLALVDALRGGRARERALAAEYLERRLNGDWDWAP
ncbi:MAG: hypothetical protein COX57_04070 [Alphaproteobacteria bacterium CG_4_10_14_0_2_um_filter_63_37]|nr:MAG: hypothetical protein AUJ55_01395 [Proteobacteria bacterium CG1_02_64_396]PJA25298.1 MAG: hypothetical protein COX57_04070 [Alphaproteobacteria bacterium CG_4_10_14_0_2_um_filter_63_37]